MARLRPFRSLATKFSLVAALLVAWVASANLYFHYRTGAPGVMAHLLIVSILLVIAVAVARVTGRALVRPLAILDSAMVAVREGNLRPIRLLQTGDEIQRLGESFNAMIEALTSIQHQVSEHQERLEEKIRERTEALEKSTNRAEAATRAKSEFLANMSHELRTPLNGVLGMIDIVLDGELTKAQREELTMAKECSLSLLALVNDILDLSKIEAGKMGLERLSFDPRELVESCCRLLEPRAVQKGLTWTCSVSPEMPACLMGDPLRLRQVVVNLLGNAVKYTNRGSVQLRLSCAPAMQPDRVELHLEVADTGIGIPQDKLATIFEKFTQADGSITKRYGGTGLGLAIARELVEMHEGHIWVESEVGRGSAFHVALELPVATSVLIAESNPAEPVAAAPPPAEHAKVQHRILVVEDNAINQQVVTGLLGKRGYATEVARHGGEALAALEAADFDLVLMDVQMPILDGLEATRLIRKDPRWKGLPIVGLTAHAMVGDRERCLAAGMNDYLAKPVRQPALLEVVTKHLQPCH